MSLDYRKKRVARMAAAWNGRLLNSLFMVWRTPDELWADLKRSIGLYVARAFDLPYVDDEAEFMRRLDARRDYRKNVTPNGGVVPKKEYQLEYNLFLRSWCNAVRAMIAPQPDLIRKFRVTPNVRLKFAVELEENVGRQLDTALPHSDAWVEGPWGMNCHVPVMGDIERNYLFFYKIRDEASFSDDFLKNAASYKDMQWVLQYYEPDRELRPLVGHINVSDYALIHNTHREASCGSRISIDTTIVPGEHEVHPDRMGEYLDTVPRIGETLLVKCHRSVNDAIPDKASAFAHYTTGNLERISLLDDGTAANGNSKPPFL